MKFTKLLKIRIPYRLGLTLILLLSAGSVVADSLSPFLSVTLDAFFAACIWLVVWRLGR